MADEKPTIAYGDFAKLDMKVGKVIEATDHPNADRLICMKVDLGTEQRQIVAGLKAWYPAESMVGKSIIVVTNLEPRNMRGETSQGMLLAASSGEGAAMDVKLLIVDGDLPPGSPVS